ncbi:histidine kinase [Kitasatospora sp. LaBMicrA B282]|uniref:histidine kinase n=1 Tax=Kitasatospora sp. LaBMicrA B282 TaxID=3420949 RepID=UPI003D0A3A4A
MYRLQNWLLRHPVVGDGGWALLLLLLGVREAVVLPGPGLAQPVGRLALAAVLAALMMVRRRHPDLAVTAAIVLGAGLLLTRAPPEPLDLGFLVLARWGACFGSCGVGRAVLVSALLVGPVAVWRGLGDGELDACSAGQLAVIAVLGSLPWLLCWGWGRWARVRRAAATELTDRVVQAETELAGEAARNRIADELHDVIAHELTAMTVQAGSAEYVALLAPQAAGEAARGIAALGRSLLAELDRLARLSGGQAQL